MASNADSDSDDEVLEVKLPQSVALGESLLCCLVEITGSVDKVLVQRGIFLQFACFLERLCPVVMELQKGRDSSHLIVEVLEAMLKDVDVAGQLVHICSSRNHIDLSTSCESIVEQLENIVHDLGRSLSLIPLSSVQNHDYTKVVIDSLSAEMQNAYFDVNGVQEISLHPLEGERENLLRHANFHLGGLTDIAHHSHIEGFPQNSRSLTDQMKLLGTDLCDFAEHYDLCMIDYLGSMDNRWLQGSNCGIVSNVKGRHKKSCLQPLYEAFVCPLTNKIMRDPVTLENGQTFEKSAIEKWFKELHVNGRPPICPVTGKVLKSTALHDSIALKSTIEEWTARNECSLIHIANSALFLDSPGDVILQALKDMQHLCQKNSFNKHRIRNAGLIPMIAEFLKSDSEQVRCTAIETLRVLAQHNESNKEAIAGTDAIQSSVKCLSQGFAQETEEAVSMLLELSSSELLCEKIGSVSGAILILIGMTSTKSDSALVEKVSKTLENLEKCNANVYQMAKYGLVEPLLRRLVEGPEEMQMEMANCLAKAVLSTPDKAYATRRAAQTLVNMLECSQLLRREAALKALNQISSHDANGKILIEAGILPPLIKGLFTIGIDQLPVQSREVSATILANIVRAGFKFESTPIDADGNTLDSEYFIHNLLHLINNTGPAIGAKLLQLLIVLVRTSTATHSIITAIRSVGFIICLIQLIDAPQKELQGSSVKLLQLISSHVGQEVAEGLCTATAELGTLIKILASSEVTEEQAAAAILLANLPVTNAALTLALLEEGALTAIVRRIDELQHGEMGGRRYVCPFLEGLVGILVRFTFMLDEAKVLALVKQCNIMCVFINLLRTIGIDEVQRLSAVGLENLSSKSEALSEFPDVHRAGFCATLFRCFCSEPRPKGLCAVHHGICSSKDTFCLVEAKAVRKLVECLDHRNVSVVEASLAALCTLLHDSVDVEQGVRILNEADAIQSILNILQENRTDMLRERAVWAVERILPRGGLACDASAEPTLHRALVDAFHYGNYNTRRTAEKALKHLRAFSTF